MDLEPVPRKTWRIVVVVLLSALALIGSTGLVSKLLFILFIVLTCGTYREFRLGQKSLKERWTFGFVPLRHRSFKLKKFTKIEVVHEPPAGMLELLAFGGMGFVYGFIVDRLFPWIGGAYQIWLNNEGDDRVLAWQGNSHAHYTTNIDKLKEVTSFSIVAR